MNFLRIISEFIEFSKDAASVSSVSTASLIRRTYKVVKAVKEFQKIYGTRCKWCGSMKSVEIHHVVPIWKDAALAHEESNFIALCRKCHFVLGHAGSFRDRYVANIKDICEMKDLYDRRILSEQIER